MRFIPKSTRNKIVWGFALYFLVSAIVAEPWLSGVPLVGQYISEVYTLKTSATFIFGTPVPYIANVTARLPNGTLATGRFFTNVAIGKGSVTLTGKGGLSVDNALSMDVRLITSPTLETNLTNAKISFEPQLGLSSPPKYDVLGLRQFAVVNLIRGAELLVNNTDMGTVWSGSQQVEYFASNRLLGAILVITNASLTSPITKQVTDTSINGILPPFMEIGSSDVTAAIRNNELTTSLTFAILFFAILDFRTKDNGDKANGNKSEEKKPEEPPDNQPQTLPRSGKLANTIASIGNITISPRIE